MSRLLEHPAVADALARLPRELVTSALRDALEDARRACALAEAPTHDPIVADALQRAEAAAAPSLRPAINASGIVLHTGLGRAVLSRSAVEAVAAAAASHTTLEVDTESGRRGSRQEHVRGLLCELTGAESALVLNNNAGAVFLAMSALAAGREVIISRGELVEIGGSFRMPDIIGAGGAALVEVGTTNRTRIRDYERALSERTGLILRCHPSNFRIVGFHEEASERELVALGRRGGVPVMDDLGSGALIDTEALGTAPTTTLQSSVAAGFDIVTASGDKLLGGPQAGIVVGRRDLVERLATHPLARALRIDKLTLAALEATLRLYRDPEQARSEILVLRYLSRSLDDLRALARELADGVVAAAGGSSKVDLVEERSQVGGGSLPGEDLPTVCVRLAPREMSEEQLAAALRQGDPPVFARIREGAVLLDPRSMADSEIAVAAQAVVRALRGAGSVQA